MNLRTGRTGARPRLARHEILDAERGVCVARRDAGEIADETLWRVLRELDVEDTTLDRDRA